VLYPDFPSGRIFVVYKPKLVSVSPFPFGAICPNNLNFNLPLQNKFSIFE